MLYDTLLQYQEANWGMIHHVFVTDPSGKVIISPPHGQSKGSHLDNNLSDSKFWPEAKRETVITDFFGFKEKTHYHQQVMSPVKDKEGQCLGVVVIEVCIDYENRLLAENVAWEKAANFIWLHWAEQKLLTKQKAGKIR